MARFEVITPVRASPQQLFELSLNVDVHTASMAGARERVIEGVVSGPMNLGDSVTWQAIHFGVCSRMTAQITEWSQPRYFVDEQVSGPFKRWRHAHYFEPEDTGETVMRDVVDFAAPFGPLGIVAERGILTWYIARLIRRRNSHLKTLAETGSPGSPR